MIFNINDIGTIIDGVSGRVWERQKLSNEIKKRTSYLLDKGISDKSKLILAHGGTPEFFADLFSIWNFGATVACVNPNITSFEMNNIIEILKPDAVLINNDNYDKFNIPAWDLGKSISNIKTEVTPQTFNLDNSALILFTSGTTGTPKGVVHTFRSLSSRISLNQTIIGSSDLQVTLCPLPTHFGHGLIGNCLTPLCNGSILILYPGNKIENILRLGECIDKYEVTFLSSVPSMWKIAIKSKKPSKRSIQRIQVGSSPLSSDLWNGIINWVGTKNVLNMYGITETANWIAGISAKENEPVDGLVGKMWGGKAMVINKKNKWCLFGSGELIVQTPSLMSGYYNLEDQTNEVLVNGWFRTGDVGKIDNNGLITLIGRRKFEINRAGLKVNPEDIDLLLERNPGVIEACAFGIPDEIAGEIVGVAIKLNEKENIEDIKQWCSDRLIKEKIPERWFVVDEIPKSDRGKINRDIVASICLNTKD